MDELRHRLGHISSELGKVGEARDRLIRFITRGTITEQDAEKELTELKRRETLMREEFGRISANLQHLPTVAEVQAAAEQMASAFRKRGWSDKVWAASERANLEFDRMTWEEARSLVQMVFAGKTADGKRMGICVDGNRGRRRSPSWGYRILGRLIDQWGDTSEAFPDEPLGGPEQKRLLETRFASSARSAAAT